MPFTAAVEVGVEILAIGATLIGAIVWALKAIVASILKRSEEYIERLIKILTKAVDDNRKFVSTFEKEEQTTHRVILDHLNKSSDRDATIMATLSSILEVQRDILLTIKIDKEHKNDEKNSSGGTI